MEPLPSTASTVAPSCGPGTNIFLSKIWQQKNKTGHAPMHFCGNFRAILSKKNGCGQMTWVVREWSRGGPENSSRGGHTPCDRKLQNRHVRYQKRDGELQKCETGYQQRNRQHWVSKTQQRASGVQHWVVKTQEKEEAQITA